MSPFWAADRFEPFQEGLRRVNTADSDRPLSYDAVLFVSFGGPDGPDDVMPFLENVLRGRNVPRERMLEVAEHYHHFAGKSPINEQNEALIAALREELEATQNEVKLDMAEQSDDRLVTLVSLGAWIRGIDIASRMVHDDYSRETAALLRQPAIVEFLVAQIDGLPESVRGEPLVVDVRQCLESSLPLISAETPSAENVEALKNLVGALRDQIAGMGETP